MKIGGLALLAAWSALSAGCALPLAWITPPVDASAAVGHRDGAGRGAAVGDFETVAMPLNVAQPTADLPIDVALGARFHWGRQDSQSFVRPAARLIVPLVLHEDNARLKAELSGGLTLDPHQGFMPEPQASVRVVWGVEDFIDGEGGGDCESSSSGMACLAGVFFGQGGAFLFAEAAYLKLAQEDVWLASVGVLLRIPASMGVGLLVGIPR